MSLNYTACQSNVAQTPSIYFILSNGHFLANDVIEMEARSGSGCVRLAVGMHNGLSTSAVCTLLLDILILLNYGCLKQPTSGLGSP